MRKRTGNRILRISKFLILCSIFACAGIAQAEVDVEATYFHPAASLYIHGDTTSASNLVAQGLSFFPENGRLLRLKELLEQQQEQDQNQENQDQQQNQDQQNDQQQQPNQDENNPENEPQSEQPPPEPQSAEQMSADEAERLLDAMRQEEQNKRMQLHPVLGAPVKVDKDW